MTRIDPLDLAVTKVIRKLMSAREMTNEDLSAQTGIHLRTIIRIRKGERAATVGELRAIAKALGTTVSAIAIEAEAIVEDD
ncbi:helix-turn-helix transcriptional regulator [Cryobacterium sp. PH31-O1]|uniref:helix-turn-helix domain-containing protein n=1 Tax=Cryobacterium sp. PH31-O1 TaxID=3046306 RepID=UPI0024BA3CEC|nr:helix-turn-helix transcriptional regulator [Cryobacterium sp. PH31-O1]MDJ0337413.1 helix-turn-helix transcriptional regulator [Cryobacterium sp. PH31-O1]